ncbi:MAG: aminoacyl-tRNA hydrolase [Treponema sp.]|jgi:PTH1 family peptidyl-tRNA hydrolase|nr:aminoacyl-tRNA hydrolase [Treponema sp.]
MLHLVVFLGNPGAEYERNRHNAGWILAEALPFFPVLEWQKKFKALYANVDSARIAIPDNPLAETLPAVSPAASPKTVPGKLHFIKPQTYMNHSGESVLAAAMFYKVKLDEIIVVHDDIELPFGTLSLKFSGGLGGHNGLRSMKTCFGSADFWRLRIGIGRPDDRIPGRGGNIESSRTAGIADWVLSDFTAAEADALVPVYNAGAGLLMQTLAVGPERLMSQWVKKNCLNKPTDD